MAVLVSEIEAALLRRASTLTNEEILRPALFNPLSLLLRRETDLSRVIGWMLDPRGSHGESQTFLSLFLDMIGIQNVTNLQSARVRLEVPCFNCGTLIGRVDIEVLHSKFVVLIENKPTAGLGPNQLERYQRSLATYKAETAKVVFMPGAGQSTTTNASVLHLATQIRAWVGQCRNLARSTEVRSFLNGLETELENRYGRQGGNVMPELLELMTETPEAVSAAIAIADARDSLTHKVANIFAASVDARVKAAGIGQLIQARPEHLFKNKDGALSIDIGYPSFAFTIAADKSDFQDLAIGICLREQDSNLLQKYAKEIVRVSEYIGASSEPPDTWWLWFQRPRDLDVGGLRTKNRPALWGWAADTSDDGLAARFVQLAIEAKAALDARSTP